MEKSAMSKQKTLSIKPLITSTIGTTLEFYDFTLFGFLVPIFAATFFPADNLFITTILGYSTFAIGYLCQPLGALLWGHIGDRKGRRIALCSSLSFMGIATLLMGSLPTYASIGICAPILMITARIIQGFATGGEIAGGLLFAMEHTHSHTQGLAGGIFNSICTSGVFLGSLAGYICSLPTMPTWAWRVPFLLGSIVAMIGIYMRKNINETPEFISIKKEEIHKLPLLDGLKKHYKEFLLFMLISAFPAIAFHMNFIYFPNLFKDLPAITDNFAHLSSTISIWCLVIMLPISGLLSDRVGKAKLMQIGASIFLVTIIFLLTTFNAITPATLLMSQVLLAISLSMFNGPWCSLVTGIFDKKVRYSCIGAGNTTAVALFGGTTPLIGTILSNMNNGHILLEIYIGIWACLGILGVRLLDKTMKIDLTDNHCEKGIINAI